MDKQEDKELAKRILLEILRQNAGKMEGKTRLYKAFYFAHLFYYKSGHGLLSDWPIVHMPNGPGIEAASDLLRELQGDDLIDMGTQPNGPFFEYWFALKKSSPSSLGPNETEAIRLAVEFVKDMTAAELSDKSHQRSWWKGQPGRPLNIYVDLLDDDEYDQDTAQIDRISRDVSAVFGP